MCVLVLINFVAEGGGRGALRRYETIVLGENAQWLKKLMRILVDRLVWMEDNRRFAGSEVGKKIEEIRSYMKQRGLEAVVKAILAQVEQNPASKKVDLIAFHFLYTVVFRMGQQRRN